MPTSGNRIGGAEKKVVAFILLESAVWFSSLVTVWWRKSLISTVSSRFSIG